jgi:hypothetical protein
MITKPNLFHWATSELSQDAFICWLLSWANHTDKNESSLRETAIHFIDKLTDQKIKEVTTVEIFRQYNGIDILCEVNKEFAILIEDKTHTKNHSEQLERYYNILAEEYDKEKIIPVYLKTGDQGEFNTVKKAGYKPFLRPDFIDILEFAIKKGINNHILNDFHEHLIIIEESFQSFKTLPVSQWHWNSWKGFYSQLSNRLGDGAWDYIPQKNGGFLGFFWCWQYKEHNDNEFEYYLQLEHGKFCFKLYPYKRENAEEVRLYYRSLLYQKAKQHNIDIYQNGRIGNYMTVAALTESYLKTDEKGIIDIDRTVKLMTRIEAMMCEI